MLISLTDQIKKIKSNIQDNIAVQRKNLEENKKNIYATNSNYNDMLHSIPAKERELLEISREQNIKNGIYSFLLQKREESELSYASTISDTRVVDHAHAGKDPVSPNKLYVLGVALFAVIGFPISIIGAREVLNANILYRKELEDATDIPIWGEVAMCKSKDGLSIMPGKRSYIAEEFRRIRYTIRQKLFGAEKKTILVTSSISGEGKSFFAAHLAASYALTGKKVLLIDLDMHNASLDKLLKIENVEGVTDILQSDYEIQDKAIALKEFEQFYYLSSGSFHNDPSELLDEKKIGLFLKDAKDHYDVIIVDSPPVNLVTDAFLISGFCDVTLFMVRHSYTPKNIVERLDQITNMNPLKNMAIIFNGVRSRGFSQKGYGYGYVYGGDKRLKKSMISKTVVKQQNKTV
jgi:capsular exopolysaccharide synthesis family protein